ncbi:MAG: hypothetical protein ABFD07_06975 [Methanobacterium sp.]
MIIKEGLFIICNGVEVKTPYFSSDVEEKQKEDEETIITENVLEDCVSWLENNNVKDTTLYLGIWFEEGGQMNWEGIDSKLMLRMGNIDSSFCISIY